MYVHPAFRTEPDQALEFLRERGFGLLIVPTRQTPVAVHVPFLCERTADKKIEIELHVARANPIHQNIGDMTDALLVVQGPDAYISPDWYGVKNQVPTWTYRAVHLAGSIRLLPRSANLAHVERLSAFFENRLLPKTPWSSDKMDARKREAMLQAIVCMRLDVKTVESQDKLIQHKGEAEHRGAIAGLRGQDNASAGQIADIMERTGADKFDW